ncbi:MAG TPA: NAD-dependent epimerase/dehydratase family protein [Acidimicrobiales bacterium]|nr:NAD-dependent epimerase/dehydratase family protein [Acidimicrobiales bacterium]
MGPSVLVTGGSGFIGRALVARLRQEGARVEVADLVPHPDHRQPCVVGDLRHPGTLAAALHPGTETVFHLAAMTSVLGSIHHPAEVYETNVALTAHLVERARQLGVHRVVLASTNAVVGGGRSEEGSGPAAGAPITEASPLRPLTPYGGSKAAAEMVLSAYAGAYGMATNAVRLTNVYGPGMGGKDSLVARVMRAALSDAQVLVYGDGAQVRDYLYVDDAVQALYLAAQSPTPGPVVAGSGRSTSVLELVDAARRATGRSIPAKHVDAPAGEMPAVVVDIARAGGLGFQPKVDLDRGLAETWADFLAREGGDHR